MKYKEDIKEYSGFPGGWVSTDDVNPAKIPDAFLSDVLNLDLYKTYSELRKPIKTSDVSGLYKSDANVKYTIINFAKVRFSNGRGLSEDVYVAIALNQLTNKFDIISIGYYFPEADYENSYISAGAIATLPAFKKTEMITCLTERYEDITFSYVSPGVYDVTIANKHSLSSGITMAKYFKGFYVSSKDGSGNIFLNGFVSDCTNTAGDTWRLTIDDMQYPADFDPYGLYRFPCSMRDTDSAGDIYANITTGIGLNKKYHITEKNNEVLFTFGTDYRNLWLGFIKDRHYFQAYDIDVTYGGTLSSYTNIVKNTAFYSEDTTIYLKFDYSNPGGVIHQLGVSKSPDNATWTLLKTYTTGGALGTTISDTVNIDGRGLLLVISGTYQNFKDNDLNTIQIDITINDTSPVKWDGFYFDFETPIVENKKIHILFTNGVSGNGAYRIGKNYPEYYKNGYTGLTNVYDTGKEMQGIRWIATTGYGDNFAGNDGFNDRLYAMCFEIDGKQALFVKHIIGVAGYIVQALQLEVRRYFNRRITASLLFYKSYNLGLSAPYEIEYGKAKETYLLETDIPGYNHISKWANVSGGTFNQYCIVNLAYDTKISNKETNLEKYATGTTLQSYLNNLYYSNVAIRSKGCIYINGYSLLYNIKEELTDDKDELTREINGEYAFALSNLQQGVIKASNVYCNERISEYSKRPVLAGCYLAYDQFLLFTEETCEWYEIADYENNIIRKLGHFELKGVYDEYSVVSAIYQDNAKVGTSDFDYGAKNFNGVYWRGKDKTLYGFFNNEPVDLLDGRLREYFVKNIDIANYFACGYLHNKKEVWFQVKNSVDSKAYVVIFRIEDKQLRKYAFGNFPFDIMSQNTNGELLLLNGNVIYTTDTKSSTNVGTADATGYTIAMTLMKPVCGKSLIIRKIVDRLRVDYTASGSTTYPSMYFDIYRDNGTSLLAKTKQLTMGNFSTMRLWLRTRKRNKLFYIYLTNSTNWANLTALKINNILVKFYYAGDKTNVK